MAQQNERKEGQPVLEKVRSRRAFLGSGYPNDPKMREALLEHMNKILEDWKVDTSDVRLLMSKYAISDRADEDQEDLVVGSASEKR